MSRKYLQVTTPDHLLQEGLPVDDSNTPRQLATVKGADLLGTPLSVRIHTRTALQTVCDPGPNALSK